MSCTIATKIVWCPCCNGLKQEAFCKTQWSLVSVLFGTDKMPNIARHRHAHTQEFSIQRFILRSLIIIAPYISLLLFPSQIKAEEDGLRHHVIVAIDKAGCYEWSRSSEVARIVKNILFNNRPADPTLYYRDFLVKDGDYVSFVGFSIKPYAKDMDTYVLPLGDSRNSYRDFISRNGKNYSVYYSPYKYKTYSECKELICDWDDIVGNPNSGNNNYSLVSVAKPYALRALKDDSKEVNRTFILLITDHRYNGGDFYEEIKAFNMKSNGRLSYNKIFKKCYEVEQNYFIKYIQSQEIGAHKYIELYEYVPLQQNFSLTSVISHEPVFYAKRQRGGGYDIEIKLSNTTNPLYKVKELNIFPNNSDQVEYKTPNSANKITCPDGKIDITLHEHIPSRSNNMHIEIRAWVKLVDNVYNATLLTPNKDAPVEYGKKGLNQLVPVKFEGNETILGVLDLQDWMWPFWIDTQHSAVLFWNALIIILLLALVITVFVILTLFTPPYHPTTADFKLAYKDSENQQ